MLTDFFRFSRNPGNTDQCSDSVKDGTENAFMFYYGRRRNCMFVNYDFTTRYFFNQ